MADTAPRSTREVLQHLSRIALADTDLEDVLANVVDIARRVIDPATDVSVTLVDHGEPASAAYTGGLALRLDERQYGLGHGPCLDAARTGAEMHIHDMTTETRWPDYTPGAAELGARSSLSLPLRVDEEIIGALNVYSMARASFGEAAIDTARDFTAYAGIILHNAKVLHDSQALAQQMTQAMASRAVIEQAKGILMGERRCTADQAFDLLVKVSQSANRKLRDVAQALVDSAAGNSFAP